MLATDYDNTIAVRGVAGPEVRRALEAVRRSGRVLVMVTGRTEEELDDVFDDPGMFDALVLENGALVRTAQGDRLLGPPIPQELVAALRDDGVRLPFAIEVVGFGDEEGVRFGTTMLGSRALAGALPRSELETRDAAGVSIAEALLAFGLDPQALEECRRAKNQVLAYVELHIEQGPVLESEGLPVGVVSAISGFSRMRVVLTGRAGHAGTVPMPLRRDALAAAAECVLAVERIARANPESVATVGRIEASPGAINVIPGRVAFTVDVRAPGDALCLQVVEDVRTEIARLAKARSVDCEIQMLQQLGVAECAPWLVGQLERAVAAEGIRVRRLPSGAGHDGMALKSLADIAMLFVRCKDGVSHNPAEAIAEEDAAAGARVLHRFIRDFQPAHR